VKALVVAEFAGSRLRDVTRELVSAASDLGGTVAVAALGAPPDESELSLTGVGEVIRVPMSVPDFESDIYAGALAELLSARDFDIILLPFTVMSMSYAPAVAAQLNLGYASDVFEIGRVEEKLVATRAFYGAKVHALIEFPAGKPVLMLLRAGVWPAAARGGAPTVSEFNPAAMARRARHVGFKEPPPPDVDITKADFILAIGRGIGQREQLARFEQLAERIGATLAVSRPLVDAGWIASARQVGQSGHNVKPRVYLAFGISGAVQHLAGMKDSQIVIAINRDPEAAIFSVAHYAAVADLFEVAEALEAIFD
jgi:electron transfer flavoprotein alpha subunit